MTPYPSRMWKTPLLPVQIPYMFPLKEATARHAIEQSSNGSTIYLADGNYSGKNNRNLTIDKSLSIVGNSRDNVIIDGENIARIFIINSPIAVKLDSMTLINGYEAPVKTTPEGGAIYSYGASLTLNKVTVKNSNGNDNGGAVYNYLGSLTVIDSDCWSDSNPKFKIHIQQGHRCP